LERYVGVTLRAGLKEAREQLKREATAARATFNAVRTRADLDRVADQVATLRKRYLQTELLVDFYVAAVRARANSEVGLQLRACDVMAERTVRGALEPLAIKAPPIMTYFTTGIGASILRIGTTLWDGSLSPIAAIRLTYHNRFRTTSLFHECGHQFAGMTGWNDALVKSFRSRLSGPGSELVDTIASWASEIAADMQRSSPFQTLSLGEGQKCSGSCRGILTRSATSVCSSVWKCAGASTVWGRGTSLPKHGPSFTRCVSLRRFRKQS
jgi:hypothetical protein